ncbi:hydroxyethylthiazole kinase [Bifidobacterium gallicum]|uniref:Hydroxyethylthiazole kinase n=1 Tax=Bifidobacterium gallicum DSM 20093 = LMG 11596 TaxID=561180 RepID=D1NSS7_9BIFI|nr:hydroxyethylthiazole kinase [Bifidobacterium gallicum]EFA23729.1 putative hydroxyethylthiazole kinase [Bifidobacterium gallicum DSM 20093 = LMG 11596]KFI59252.1 hydroxyethylthiazole kinase [Bifidobacterium gallicum DSM 20093 = LMG 11596]
MNMPAQDPIRLAIAEAVQQVHDTTPMAPSFTNFVTINLVANAQLACGGSAAMSFLSNEFSAVAALAKAAYINVGTLMPSYPDALRAITADLKESGKPWVLDPVAAGLGATRTNILMDMRHNPPTIVRGNASEIIALASMWGLIEGSSSNGPEGVESADDVQSAIEPARLLARFLAQHSPDGKAAVAVSGETDLVTDGTRTFRLPGGSPLMTKITGAGCSLGGVTAVYLCVAEPLIAALAASALYNVAAECAVRTLTSYTKVNPDTVALGPGTFQPAFLDALAAATPEQVASATLLEDK